MVRQNVIHNCMMLVNILKVNAGMDKSMQRGLADRIVEVRDRLGGTRHLTEATGISQSYLSRLMNAVIDNPGSLQLIRIAQAGNVSVDYLLTGAAAEERVADSVADIHGQNLAYFDRSIFAALGIQANECRTFTIQNDALKVYQPGDVLLVRLKCQTGDGVYLVDFGGGPSVRRLAWLPGGLVDVISDNYGSNKIPVADLNIIGRVVWAGIKQ